VVVVADTSVLLNLGRIEEERLLIELFREVWIPPAVRAEFVHHSTHHPRFLGLRLPGWICESAPVTITPVVASLPDLHAAESEALSLALEKSADAVLLDEIAARQAAVRLGLQPIGVLGILVRARAAGLIPAIKPLLLRLEQAAGFWLDPALRDRILQQWDESA